MNYEDHPISEIFPLLSESELRELADSVMEIGLKVPITLYEGKILDGRNRYRACLVGGVEPDFIVYSGSTPVSDVIAWNLKRRHLDATQKAAVAVEALPFFEAEAKKRQLATLKQNVTDKAILPERDQGQARDHAAKLTGVSARYVSEMKSLKESNPEIFDECKAGIKTLPEAKREIGKAEHAKKIEAAKSSPRPKLSDSHFIILADPPWRYDFNETESREIENHYPTATVEEIAAHSPKSAKTDSILFLWATAPKLREALSVLSAWGFEYITHAMWDKQMIGQGYWFRGQHELLLVGVKGNPGTVPEPARRGSIFSEARGRHSVKPECVYTWIEEAFPLETKLEMYCRSPRDGWDVMGNEV